jgi:GntR family transcriptional regulator
MLITINDDDIRPVYMQIIDQVKEQIQKGYLKPGDELPSFRELSQNLGINMHTVRHAYDELRNQGILVFRLGQRARVAKWEKKKPDKAEIEDKIGTKLEYLLTEAFLMGLSGKDFRNIVEEKIEKNKGIKR